MKIKFYENSRTIVTGMTLKDISMPEEGNMALHACISEKDVVQNRLKLAAALGISPSVFVCPNQTHSANFYRVTSKDAGRGALSSDTAITDTDALYTYEPHLLLCCLTADCVPLLFYNEKAGLAGAVHSGWQGTVKEITLKLFNHLAGEENCNPADFKAYIGAAISREKFEVDEDVYLKYEKLTFADEPYALPFVSFKEETGKYHIDNKAVVRRQCELAGIPPENITVDSVCTFQSSDCFSYRRDKKSGRHLSFIMRRIP